MANDVPPSPIIPKDKSIERLFTRLGFFFLGMGFQTAYRVDPVIKKEIDSWPDPFTFVISVKDGPRMVVQKRNGCVRYLGEKETFIADAEMCFKHVQFAFLSAFSMLSTPEAIAHNRIFAKGDVSVLISVTRVLKRLAALLIPKGDPALKDDSFWEIMRIRILLHFNSSFGIIK